VIAEGSFLAEKVVAHYDHRGEAVAADAEGHGVTGTPAAPLTAAEAAEVVRALSGPS
jgi:hypothetical protein